MDKLTTFKEVLELIDQAHSMIDKCKIEDRTTIAYQNKLSQLHSDIQHVIQVMEDGKK